MRRLSDREQRILAIGILVLLIAVVWLAVAAPILDGFSKRALEREQLLATYARNQRVLAALPIWRTQLDQQRRTAPIFAIQAPTPGQAGDQLRERLARTFAGAGVEVRAVQDLPSESRKGWVAARIDLRLTQTQLNAGLERLENEEPYVLVDYFAVAAERAFETGQSGPVDVRIDVSARYRPVGGPQGEGSDRRLPGAGGPGGDPGADSDAVAPAR
jgi:hypothetical protein